MRRIAFQKRGTKTVQLNRTNSRHSHVVFETVNLVEGWRIGNGRQR